MKSLIEFKQKIALNNAVLWPGCSAPLHHFITHLYYLCTENTPIYSPITCVVQKESHPDWSWQAEWLVPAPLVMSLHEPCAGVCVNTCCSSEKQRDYLGLHACLLSKKQKSKWLNLWWHTVQFITLLCMIVCNCAKSLSISFGDDAV